MYTPELCGEIFNTQKIASINWSLTSSRVGYSHDVTETRILNVDMYTPMALQKFTRGYCLVHFYVRIVSLIPSSYVHQGVLR